MGRIIVNKHFDDKSLITSEKFVNKGEIIISNQKGFEGIVITNNIGETIFISPSEGSGSDVPVDYKEYVNEVVDSVVDTKLQTQGALTQVLSAATVEFSGHTVSEINRIDGSISTLRDGLNELSAYTENLVIGGGGEITGGISRKDVEEICSTKIAEVVADADEDFDTLKEIADWIKNDSTGAASMVNDIENLKTQLNALLLGAKSSISSYPNMIYVGEDTEITLTGKLIPDSLTPCEIHIYKDVLDGELVVSGTTPIVSVKQTINKKSTYALKSIYNGTSYTATTTINAYYPIYYGFGTSYEDVMSNGTKALKSSAKGNYKATADADGVNYFILVPVGVTKPSTFTMGGAPFNMSTEDILTDDGVSYTVFKSGSVFNNGGSVDITAA